MFLIFLVISTPQSSLILNPELDLLSLFLIILSVWLSLLILLANFFSKNLAFLLTIFKLILIALRLSFSTARLIIFYVFFEASLIPIFIIILSIGYQPERLLARIIIFFYTLTSSFPLLLSLLIIQQKRCSLTAFRINLISNNINSWIRLSLILAFLVKFPIYTVHLWLPKAHVEAPVSGSIILAGVLLKLGGYGLFRLSVYYFWGPLNLIFSIVRGVGGSILGILCCRVRDIKVLIAYSSVVHISLIIINLIGLRSLGLVGVWWIILAHGIVSSGIFAGANMIYERSHSRRILVNKAGLTYRPLFTRMWFFLIVINFAGPFTLNLYGEILLIVGTISLSRLFFIAVGFMSFFSAAYGIILYSSSQQGMKRTSRYFLHSSNSREILTLIRHIWPGVVILLGLSL